MATESGKKAVEVVDEVVDVDIEKRLIEAKSMSKNYVLGAMGVGLVPVPALDMAAITLVQLKMLHGLSNLYGIKFRSELGKSLIGSLIAGLSNTPLGIGVASLSKAIPIVGPILGSTSVSLAAGATTYALSRVFIQHFESGGTFLDFKPETVRQYFAEEFERGKLVAADLKKSDKDGKVA